MSWEVSKVVSHWTRSKKIVQVTKRNEWVEVCKICHDVSYMVCYALAFICMPMHIPETTWRSLLGTWTSLPHLPPFGVTEIVTDHSIGMSEGNSCSVTDVLEQSCSPPCRLWSCRLFPYRTSRKRLNIGDLASRSLSFSRFSHFVYHAILDETRFSILGNLLWKYSELTLVELRSVGKPFHEANFFTMFFLCVPLFQSKWALTAF